MPCSTCHNPGRPFNNGWISAETPIMLLADRFGYPDVAVMSTNGEMTTLASTPKKQARKMYPKAKAAIKNIDIDTIYAEKGQRWQDFCNDIANVAALEFVLFKMLIPIANPLPTHA